jgi:uncharacterized membrane protein
VQKLLKRLKYYALILKTGLYEHYSQPQLKTVKRMRDGFIYFCVGLAIIYFASMYTEPSIEQEIIALVGLILAGIGFLMAMLSYMRFVIGRVLHFFKK